ncbi:hypothetical protein TNCV_4037341 [Trichonephila clavipes]|nr:hypothetical protein TNCV_4037341 [Trichonephila clavipes]
MSRVRASTTKDPPCRAQCVNLSRAQTSSRLCGVVVFEGGAGSGVVLPHLTMVQRRSVLSTLVAKSFFVAAVARGIGIGLWLALSGSSPVPLKTRRVGQRCTLNLSRAETSSRWCGVVVRRGCQLGVVHVT